MKITKLFFLCIVLLIVGCSEDPPKAGHPGITIDSTTNEFLLNTFYEKKLELGFRYGEFDNMTITIMPPVFKCRFKSGSCVGEYRGVNTIVLGSMYVFESEVAKYLYFLNIREVEKFVSDVSPGVFIDSTLAPWLEKTFYETKECGAFEKGEFKDVSVVFMPPTFPCKHYESGCSGEYVGPNFLKIGSLYVWKHEVIHFLLDVNTGDPDTRHKNALFQNCT